MRQFALTTVVSSVLYVYWLVRFQRIGKALLDAHPWFSVVYSPVGVTVLIVLICGTSILIHHLVFRRFFLGKVSLYSKAALIVMFEFGVFFSVLVSIYFVPVFWSLSVESPIVEQCYQGVTVSNYDACKDIYDRRIQFLNQNKVKYKLSEGSTLGRLKLVIDQYEEKERKAQLEGQSVPAEPNTAGSPTNGN